MDQILRIGLDHLGLLVSEGITRTPVIVAGICQELAAVKIRVMNPEAVTDTFASTCPDVIQHIRQVRNESGTYVPLFPNFPDDLPAWSDTDIRLRIAQIRLLGTAGTNDDLWNALDFSSYGWWPTPPRPTDDDITLLRQTFQNQANVNPSIRWRSVRFVASEQLDAELRTYLQTQLEVQPGQAAMLPNNPLNLSSDLGVLWRHYKNDEFAGDFDENCFAENCSSGNISPST